MPNLTPPSDELLGFLTFSGLGSLTFTTLSGLGSTTLSAFGSTGFLPPFDGPDDC